MSIGSCLSFFDFLLCVFRRARGVFIVVSLSVTLFACESNPYASLPDVIPTSERDSAPENPKDVSTVGNAEPKYERRTIPGTNHLTKLWVKCITFRNHQKGIRKKALPLGTVKNFMASAPPMVRCIICTL